MKKTNYSSLLFFSSISFESEENEEGQQTQLKLSVQRYLHRYRDEKKRSYWHDQAFFFLLSNHIKDRKSNKKNGSILW